MDADVRHDAAGPVVMAFPRHVVPGAARGDVGQPHLMTLALVGQQLVAQGNQLRMHAQLEDGVDAATGFPLAAPVEVPVTRSPTASESALIRDRLDPDGLREKEIR